MSNRCRAWADALDNFHYTPLVLGLEDGPAALAAALEAALKDPAELPAWQIYAAGPARFLAGVQTLLTRHGVAPECWRGLRTDPAIT